MVLYVLILLVWFFFPSKWNLVSSDWSQTLKLVVELRTIAFRSPLLLLAKCWDYKLHHHAQIWAKLGIKSGVSCIIGKQPTK